MPASNLSILTSLKTTDKITEVNKVTNMLEVWHAYILCETGAEKHCQT